MSSPRRLAGLAVFRHPQLARFVAGRFCMAIGWQMLAVAVGWQIYSFTHDPLALGLVGLAEFAPFVVLVLLGGHVADRAERRVVLLSAFALQCVCIATLLGLTLAGNRASWPIYLTIAVFGAARAFWMPTAQAIVPSLVPREEFRHAVAINASFYQAAIIAGPALGGVLFLLGTPIVYGSCLLLFLVNVALMSSVRPQRVPRQALVADDAGILEGLRYVLRQRVLLGLISLDLFAVLFGGATALLPVFAADVLRSGPVGLGLLRAAPGLGAAVTAGVLALRPIERRAGLWMFGGVALFGVATIAFGLSRSLGASLLALFAMGGGDMFGVYVRNISMQLNTPDAIRGRVGAINSMFIGASNELGEFESGLTARWFGAVRAVVLGGAASVLVVASWATLFPELRRLDRLR